MCDCASSPCGCNDLNIAVGPPGRQGEPGGPPNLAIGTVTTLAPGDPATATITGTSPDYELNLGIPAGATGTGTPGTNGTNGINAFTTTTASYVQPTDSGFGTVLVSVAEVGWCQIGQKVYISGAGTYACVGKVPATPGYTGAGQLNLNLIPVGSYAAVGNTVASGAGVSPSGEPGQTGATGPAGGTGATGASSVVSLVTTIPTSAPAPGYEFQFYTDSLTLPTIFRGYYWNGTTWTAGPNILTGFGSTTTVSITSPSSVPINFQYSRTLISTNSDVTVTPNTASLVDHGNWMVFITKAGGPAATINYIGWNKATGLTLPTSITGGQTAALSIKYDGTTPIIENAYIVTTAP